MDSHVCDKEGEREREEGGRNVCTVVHGSQNIYFVCIGILW